ncbi:hypothetical protein [Niallia sp. 01092]|uniref:hypothetical protein n=1 Tax=unclassified Niallia TaxID=2837522 RepID=UPI003FD21E74
MIFLRFGEKSSAVNQIDAKLLGVNLHDFMEKESNITIELASEFGLSLEAVKKLKKQLERN